MNKKIWITTGVIAALVGAYSAGGFWGVPYAINWGLKKYAEPFLDRSVTAKDVKFNPFSLHLKVRGLEVKKEGEPIPFMQLRLLDTKLSWKSLFHLSPMVSHVKMDAFDANVIRTGLDTFNFTDIIQKLVNMPSSPEEKKDSPVQFAIENVTLTNSNITLDDKFRDKVDKITDINFALPLISNFKKEVDSPIKPKLEFDFNGEPLSINASSELFIPSLKTGVDFTLHGLNLENAATFNPVPLNLKVAKGTMDAALNLAFARTVDKNEGYLRLRGTLKILNLSLQDELHEPYEIASIREININLKQFSLFRQILELGEVQFQEPKFTIIRNGSGINAVELAENIVKQTPASDQEESPAKSVKESTDTAPEMTAQNVPQSTESETQEPGKGPNAQPDPGWTWSVEKASVRDGSVMFSDTTNGFKQTIDNIDASATALKSDKDSTSDVSLSLNALGGSLGAKGFVEVSPLTVDLDLSGRDLSVSEVSPYIAEFAAAKVPEGTVGVNGKFKLSSSDGLSFSFNGEANASGLVVDEPNGNRALSLDTFKAIGITVSGTSPLSVRIADIGIIGPKARVVLSKNGSINLMSLAQAPATNNAPQTSTSQSKDGSATLQWELGRIHLESGTVDFSDESNGFHKVITPIGISLSSLGSKNPTSSLTANFGVLGGTISATGSLQLSPFRTDLATESKGIQLIQAMPYVSQYSNVHILAGSFGNKGKLVVSTASDPISLSYSGSASLSGVRVADSKGVPVISLQNFRASGIEFKGLSALSLKIASVDADGPNVQIAKGPDGKINLASLLKTDKNSAAETSTLKNGGKSKGQKSSSPQITINSFKLSNGRLRYTDNAVKPQFVLNATQLTGSLGGFSTARSSDANVNVKGLLDGTPMDINGKLNPFASKLSLAMKGSVTSLSLPTFSPLAAQVTGYPITQGQVTYTGDISLKDDELKSENNMVINKLAFGPQVPDAKETLPVGLAVSLLQDRSGQIDLNIPVSGSLKDPEFSVGGIVVKVIVNLITKAVTAPFSLIGSMFGGGNMDLSNLPFASGSPRLDEKTIKALQVVGKAMNDRPAIKIQIIGSALADADDSGLKERLLMRDMRYAIYRDSASTVTRSLTEAQKEQAIKSIFSDYPVPNKPKLTDVSEMRQYLLAHQRVTRADLITLADQRAAAVRNYLIQKEKINPNRLFIVTSRAGDTGGATPGVSLGLQD